MSRIKIPVIAVVGEDGTDPGGNANFVVRKAYTDAISRAGGLPITVLDLRAAKEYVNLADALLLTDGPVMHPWRYGELIRDFGALAGFSRTRDDLDFGLVPAFEAAGKPVFGIGRGLYVLAASAGGKLSLREQEEKKEDQKDGLITPLSGERVHTKEKSLAEKIFGEEKEVKGVFRYRIEDAGSLRACAWGRDGDILAAESPDGKIFGTAWNPEFGPDSAFFGALVKAAGGEA